jgi:hypothetical protein
MAKIKNEFLYLDTQMMEYKERMYNLHLERLNKLVIESEKVLKRTLKDQEKQKLKKDGADFVFFEIKDKFQFPNADDSFNFKSLGINIEPFKEATNLYKGHNFEADLLEGKFIPSKKQINKIKEDCAVYTVNEKQKHALEISNKIIAIVRDAENNHIPINKLNAKNLFKGVKMDNNNELLINGGFIASIS